MTQSYGRRADDEHEVLLLRVRAAARTTPLVLVAIGHDARSGIVHVYRPHDGPLDSEIATLLQVVATELMRG